MPLVRLLGTHPTTVSMSLPPHLQGMCCSRVRTRPHAGRYTDIDGLRRYMWIQTMDPANQLNYAFDPLDPTKAGSSCTPALSAWHGIAKST